MGGLGLEGLNRPLPRKLISAKAPNAASQVLCSPPLSSLFTAEELQLTDMKLKAVTLVLGRHDGVNSLEDVSGAISSYLGPRPTCR